MLNTHVRAVRDLRNNYPELADIVKNHDRVIITNNGKSESVLISFDEYNKYEEYLHYRYADEKLSAAENGESENKLYSREAVLKILRESSAEEHEETAL